ncbi:MAG: TIGR03086 family protein [Mycobacteriaceae bacterium]|nr:TIGR03086 family protein [Mycobacteriaceae bacterium]MBV9639659.1 TIGR03086 family protein [Mycobacteriaceae bacterium]
MLQTDELTVLADATRYLLGGMLLVRDADLSAPTPCPDWDLGALLRHLHTSLDHVTDVLAPREFRDRRNYDPRCDAGADPVAAIRARIVDLLLAWRAAPAPDRWCEIWGRSLPAKVVAYVASIEMAVHGWDIAQACQTDRPIPADLAAALLTVSPPLAQAGEAGNVFAKPVAVATTATPSDRLLALFGRATILTS